jgi:Arc/MetJ-type ribon-helix-helix transcriptional regulator
MVDRLETLVDDEEFVNRSDATRTAVWDLLRRYGYDAN